MQKLLTFVIIVFSTIAFAEQESFEQKYILSLSKQEQQILYNYSLLLKYSDEEFAENFWSDQQVLNIDKETRVKLAENILLYTDLSYNPPKATFIKSVFNTTNILIIIAAIMATIGTIMAINKYKDQAIRFIRYKVLPAIIRAFRFLTPIILWLRSPLVLTVIFLLAGILLYASSFFIRLFVFQAMFLHGGIILIWIQISILMNSHQNSKTRYLISDLTDIYYNELTPKNMIKLFTFPIFIVIFCIVLAFYLTNYKWLIFELIFLLIIFLLTIPYLNKLVINLYFLILPSYENTNVETKNAIAGAGLALIGFISALLLHAPMYLIFYLSIYTSFLILTVYAFHNKRQNKKIGRAYSELLIILLNIVIIMVGIRKNSIPLSLVGIISLSIYSFIKYIRILDMLSYSWRKHKSLILIAIAFFIWLLAILIKYFMLNFM